MQEFHCHATKGGHECGRFLLRLEGGYIVIRCPMCKTEQRIALKDLATAHASEAREIEQLVNGQGGLLW